MKTTPLGRKKPWCRKLVALVDFVPGEEPLFCDCGESAAWVVGFGQGNGKKTLRPRDVCAYHAADFCRKHKLLFPSGLREAAKAQEFDELVGNEGGA